MKYLITIKIILLLGFTLNAQEKKDTKIIVHTDTAGKFDSIRLFLYERGYSVETKDDALKFISSTEKSFSSYSVVIRALVKDSFIVFTGQIAGNITVSLSGVKAERTVDNVYYGGMKGSALRKTWDEVLSFAKLFGSKITYSK